jgi:hypothetical protein
MSSAFLVDVEHVARSEVMLFAGHGEGVVNKLYEQYRDSRLDLGGGCSAVAGLFETSSQSQNAALEGQHLYAGRATPCQ